MIFYVSYDVRGIQRYIFAIPRLRAIVGGSAAIDQLDVQIRNEFKSKVVFAGGGRGLLESDSEQEANAIETRLCELAAEDGLDLQIGIDVDLNRCMEQADRMHTYIPNSLDGDPCEASALYPVPKAGRTHPIIQKRFQRGRADELGSQLIQRIGDRINLPKNTNIQNPRYVFFRDVNPDKAAELQSLDEAYQESDETHAICGKKAIGGRNRWSIVALDVNGLGEQFSRAKDLFVQPNQYAEWLRKMSRALSESVRQAFEGSLVDVINQWLRDNEKHLEDFCYNHDGTSTLVLPFRPLICGGDDIVLLSHPKYAITIAREVCRAVNAECTRRSKSEQDLWPATKPVGPTMSAGVLFCATSMPLASAIDYTKSLLSNAKSAYRKVRPMPAAIDFEMITESLLDTPAERRRREMEFTDRDTEFTMSLSNRPFLLEGAGPDSLDYVFRLRKDVIDGLPRSLAIELLSKMYRPWSERFEFLASVSKRHPILFERFTTMDSQVPGPEWIPRPDTSGRSQSFSTCLADAILLFQEDERMKGFK